jgi:thiamine biosynthesis protein ThiS
MELNYNNNKFELLFSGTISELLKEQNIDNTKIAIQINNKIIPRNKWSEYILSKEDKIFIIEIIAGG